MINDDERVKKNLHQTNRWTDTHTDNDDHNHMHFPERQKIKIERNRKVTKITLT